MSDVVIRVENLSKRYTIRTRGDGSARSGDGLRHALQNAVSAPLKRIRARWRRSENRLISESQNLSLAASPPSLPSSDSDFNSRRESSVSEDFYALRDVSFEVERGQVLGIIGRNGAGKSTLLKILSRITEPTTGRVGIKGRVASLLEVGTGFHPELSGRENIYLNGAILGMSRAEVRSKFDDIVAFAEVGPFLDTPVKRYSSGMYVRLAFAVSAHLQTDILIVDEVLAVGDLKFQTKCLGKMREVATGEGRTVLFVSHSMSAITRLCQEGALLAGGRLLLKSDVNSTIQHYLSSVSTTAGVTREVGHLQPLRLHKKVFFVSGRVIDHNGSEATQLDVRHGFRVELEYEVTKRMQNIELSIRIQTGDGRPVMTSLLSDVSPEALSLTKKGGYSASVEFPGMFFMPGDYVINAAAHEPAGELFDLQEGIARFTIQDTGTNYAKYKNYEEIGVVMKDLAWKERQSAIARVD